MYDFYDIESGEVVTLTELKDEYETLRTDEPWNVEGMSFNDYVANCLTIHGGTLERMD